MSRTVLHTSLAIAAGGLLGWIVVDRPARTETEKNADSSIGSPTSQVTEVTLEQRLAAENSPASRAAIFASHVMSATSARELVSIYLKLDDLRSALPPGIVEQLLLPKLAQLDGALAFRTASDEHKAIVLTVLAETDSDALIESVRTMTPDERLKYAPDALKAIANSDPIAVLNLLKDGTLSGFDTAGVEQHALRTLAKGDPATALQWLEDTPLASRERLATSFVEGWSEIDPEKAFHWAIEIRAQDSKSWGQPGGSAMRKWGEKDPYAALDRLFELKDPKLIGQVATDLFENAARLDPDKALELLDSNEEMRDDVHKAAIAGIAKGVVHTDLDLALELADRLPAFDRYLLDGAIIRSQVDADPEAAYEWAKSQTTHREKFLDGITNLMGTAGEIRVFLDRSIADGVWSDSKDVPNFFNVVNDLAQADEEDAIAWIKQAASSLPEEVLQNSMSGVSASPTFINRLITEFPQLDLKSLAQGTAAELARQDPQVAAEWLESLPEEMQSDARASVSIGMAQADLAKGREWALALVDPEDRNRAINNVTQIHADLGELPPLDLILQSTGEIQDFLLQQHFNMRALRDPDEAKAALDQLELESNAALESIVENPKPSSSIRLRFR